MSEHRDTGLLDVWVESRQEGADGVVVLDLAPLSGTLPAWEAGAHVDVILPNATVRQYSLVGPNPDESRYRIAVLLESAGRGGSRLIHSDIHVGTRLQVRGPRNHFALEPADRYVFVAGGIGITPILRMIDQARAASAIWELHYGGRSRASMAFLGELKELAGGEVHVHPQDEVGLLPLESILTGIDDSTFVYCCGPGPLLDAVEGVMQERAPGRLRVERFEAKELDEPEWPGGFQVELASTGEVLSVGPDEAILDVLEEHGVEIFSSCRDGTCGTCETGVVSGAIEHRDSVMSPEEQAANDTMFVCVSRARCPRIVLDL